MILLFKEVIFRFKKPLTFSFFLFGQICRFFFLERDQPSGNSIKVYKNTPELLDEEQNSTSLGFPFHSVLDESFSMC